MLEQTKDYLAYAGPMVVQAREMGRGAICACACELSRRLAKECNAVELHLCHALSRHSTTANMLTQTHTHKHTINANERD